MRGSMVPRAAAAVRDIAVMDRQPDKDLLAKVDLLSGLQIVSAGEDSIRAPRCLHEMHGRTFCDGI